MKLKVTDSILVTAIQSDVLVPGTVVTVMPAEGEQLLKRHPEFFVAEGGEDDADGAAPKAKAAKAPKNKAAPAAKNKAKGGEEQGQRRRRAAGPPGVRGLTHSARIGDVPTN